MRITVLRNPGSRSARLIAEGLRAQGMHVGLASVDSVRRCRGDRYVINWGVAAMPRNFRQRRLTLSNSVEGVNNCRDKHFTLICLNNANVPCLEWARGEAGKELAGAWLREDKKIVVRHTTTGHSGAGIEIVRAGDGGGRAVAIPQAPLYTRYFRKDAEYRVHVGFGGAIHIQQKRRRNGWDGEAEDHLIRTHANGYVFATQNLSCDGLNYRAQLVALALSAAAACGVNHAAVDILAHHSRSKGANLVVCELNSGPACDADSTRDAYIRAFAGQIHV